MRLWDFESTDGQVKEFLVPDGTVNLDQDGKHWRRRPVQPFVFVHTKARTMGDEVLRGYRIEEEKRGSRMRTRLPADSIKKAWADETTT